MRDDCAIWMQLLRSPDMHSRPFMDWDDKINAEDIGLFSDASRAEVGKGLGCYFRTLGSWTSAIWDPGFIQSCDPSIQFLELYALVVGVLIWIDHFKNKRVVLHCDNESVVHMVNNSTSSCKHCMILIRKLTFISMQKNARFFAKHVDTKSNPIADALSRNDMNRFWDLVPTSTNKFPEKLPEEIWPIPHAWFS